MSINTKAYIEQNIKIRDKSGEVIDFVLNQPQQKLYDIIKKQKLAGDPVRIIILKARQMGFSTLTEAVLFKETATKFNVNTGIIAHKEEATTNLFNMSKRMYDNLPDKLKPAKRSSNAKELLFDTIDGKGLKSKIKCMTAGGEGVGRSDTFNNLHISELAFWSGDKKGTLTGLFQAVPNLPNSIIIIESTANGFEYYKELWDRAVNGESGFHALFVGWHEMADYVMPYTGFDLTEEEVQIKEMYELSDEQLTWRRWCIANNCGGDLELFKQEYPINPQEAFISTGACIFDKDKIINRIQELSKIRPFKTGYFIYDYDGEKPRNIKWVNDHNGYINLYAPPERYRQYVIGADTAGEGSDFFAAHVLDAQSGEQVAVLRRKDDADMFAKQIYCLGRYYQEALISIEANFDSYPIRELTRFGYNKQYVREKEDTLTHKVIRSFGFKTTSISRPVIISNLVEVVREDTESINDIPTLEEMLTFIRNEKGRAEAQQGSHDDLVMSLAIAHRSREQVIFRNEPIIMYQKANFEVEKNKYGLDYGDKLLPC